MYNNYRKTFYTLKIIKRLCLLHHLLIAPSSQRFASETKRSPVLCLSRQTSYRCPFGSFSKPNFTVISPHRCISFGARSKLTGLAGYTNWVSPRGGIRSVLRAHNVSFHGGSRTSSSGRTFAAMTPRRPRAKCQTCVSCRDGAGRRCDANDDLFRLFFSPRLIGKSAEPRVYVWSGTMGAGPSPEKNDANRPKPDTKPNRVRRKRNVCNSRLPNRPRVITRRLQGRNFIGTPYANRGEDTSRVFDRKNIRRAPKAIRTDFAPLCVRK